MVTCHTFPFMVPHTKSLEELITQVCTFRRRSRNANKSPTSPSSFRPSTLSMFCQLEEMDLPSDRHWMLGSMLSFSFYLLPASLPLTLHSCRTWHQSCISLS